MLYFCFCFYFCFFNSKSHFIEAGLKGGREQHQTDLGGTAARETGVLLPVFVHPINTFVPLCAADSPILTLSHSYQRPFGYRSEFFVCFHCNSWSRLHSVGCCGPPARGRVLPLFRICRMGLMSIGVRTQTILSSTNLRSPAVSRSFPSAVTWLARGSLSPCSLFRTWFLDK